MKKEKYVKYSPKSVEPREAASACARAGWTSRPALAAVILPRIAATSLGLGLVQWNRPRDVGANRRQRSIGARAQSF